RGRRTKTIRQSELSPSCRNGPGHCRFLGQSSLDRRDGVTHYSCCLLLLNLEGDTCLGSTCDRSGAFHARGPAGGIHATRLPDPHDPISTLAEFSATPGYDKFAYPVVLCACAHRDVTHRPKSDAPGCRAW